MDDRRQFPNLFWPIILIGIGTLYLLANLGIIEMINIFEIWRLWPVFLVIAGVNMLFGQNNRLFASLLSGLLALLVVAFLLFAPSLMDSLPVAEMQTEIFREPAQEARAVDVLLDFDRGNIEINSLMGNSILFEAEVTHDEEVTFTTSGSNHRNISLQLDQIGPDIFTDWLNQSRVRAEVLLVKDVPASLNVNIGGGSADMLLSELTLNWLKADSGSGNLTAALPDGDYPVELSSGSGSISVTTSEDTELDMKVDVGSGRINITLAKGNYGELKLDSGSGLITVVVPKGAAVQLRGETGSGSVSVPSGFMRIYGGDQIVGDSGSWETEGFEDSQYPLVIRFEIGSGSIRIEYP